MTETARRSPAISIALILQSERGDLSRDLLDRHRFDTVLRFRQKSRNWPDRDRGGRNWLKSCGGRSPSSPCFLANT